jgi:hypothetical protein
MIQTTSAQQMALFDYGDATATRLDRHLGSEQKLVEIAISLGASKVAGWSAAEEKLARGAKSVPDATLTDVRARIEAGEDPLGEAFCRLRPATERRARGATFTPPMIVDSMVQWAAESAGFTRIV